MRTISRVKPAPLHAQIRQAIAAEIASGRLGPGAQLPAEHDYAKQFGVSLAPVRQALLDLATAGQIVRRKGLGTFVAARQIEEEVDLLRSFTDNLRERGVEFEMQFLDITQVTAPAHVAREFGAPAGVELVRLRRLAWIQGEPSVLLDSFLPAGRFGRLTSLPAFRAAGSLWATLAEDFNAEVSVSRATIDLAHLSDEDAELLHLAPTMPVVRLLCHNRDQSHELVEVSWVLYRADRFKFTFTSQR